MDTDFDVRYRHLLTKHLAMNKDTWATLQSRGVTESAEICLDFAFVAPDRAHAEALHATLVDQTDYRVEVASTGRLFSKRWSVEGSTRRTAVSAEILDQWVTWMVTAGLHQGCEFDGWGAEV